MALPQDIDRFKLLGSTTDNSPGEAMDKVARSLKLHTVREELRHLPGEEISRRLLFQETVVNIKITSLRWKGLGDCSLGGRRSHSHRVSPSEVTLQVTISIPPKLLMLHLHNF